MVLLFSLLFFSAGWLATAMVLPQENATAGTVVTGTPKVAHSIDMPILPAPHGETNQTPDGHQECRRAGEKACPAEPSFTIYRARQIEAQKQLTTILVTCDHNDYPQACAHYHSAIHDGGRPAKFTCETSQGGREDGTFVADWKKQHKNREWKSFTRTITDQYGNIEEPACQVDEYPPAYFVNSDNTPQLIRWIPRLDNSGAAQSLWTRFCLNHDGDVGNGQRVETRKGQATPIEQREFNTDLVDLKDLHSETNRGRDQRITVTSIWERAKFTRAVWSLAFSYEPGQTPRRSNQWHLESNGCWPKAIVPGDPGYVLLTNDKWYDNHDRYPHATDSRGLYAYDPTPEQIHNAEQLQAKIGNYAPAAPEEYAHVNASTHNFSRPRESEKLELLEGRLIARDIATNATRPLTDDEIRHQIEIISCKDKHCAAELHDHEVDSHTLVIPAIPPPSLPSTNENAVPTFSPTPSMRTEIKPMKRTKVSPDAPTMTS